MSNEARTETRLKVSLIVVSILFAISLITNLYLYTRQYVGITPDGNLEQQIADLQSQLDSLNTTHQNYVSIHSHSNLEYAILENQIANLQDQTNSLQTQINHLKSAKLILVNLYGTDIRLPLTPPYFYVEGEVVNVGTDYAFNCKLHVILYQGAIVAIDTYLELGTIIGEGYTTVDSKITYLGGEITSQSITAVIMGVYP